MSTVFFVLLDVVLIGLLIAGIIYALRLNQNLMALRASRADMERFVNDFSGTVTRAEISIKGLKQAARDCGDDLEQLIERSQSMRDELQFLIESADQIANRLSSAATLATSSLKAETPVQPAKSKEAPPAPSAEKSAGSKPAQPATASERDLMKALEKMG